MKRGMLALACCMGAAAMTAAEPPAGAGDGPTVIVVTGAAGESEFGVDFAAQGKAWAESCSRAEARHIAIGAEPAGEGAASDRELLRNVLAAEKDGAGELWLVLVGHGTFDGREAKLNLRGPDLSASELAEWLKPVHRPMAIIDATSSSAPFLARLSAPNRVVVSATRSGAEKNYARFGGHLAAAITDPASDLDKDGQISLLEAFLRASHRTAEFYKTEGRLATEHALIDDNGDGLGTPADWFRGVLATKRAREGAEPDGARAHQFHLVRGDEEKRLPAAMRARRDQLELQVADLRARRDKMGEADYLRELEKLLLELARLNEET